jgi:hypothetical protein
MLAGIVEELLSGSAFPGGITRIERDQMAKILGRKN